ncbi:MAG: SAM-dependent methyltransferase [Eubacteriales bacterium]|nr:SAM-dependent methyltransferase [Eubacteriales bacterium]
MSEVINLVKQALIDEPYKVIISNPVSKETKYKKTVLQKTDKGYSIESFTDKQAFHSMMDAEVLLDFICESVDDYRQINIWVDGRSFEVRVSKKGKATLISKKEESAPNIKSEHNRKKNYIIPEAVIPPLIDMGVLTTEGKIVNSKQDKYRQINRFIEIVDDEISKRNIDGPINIIDFGCGKSYLTFILYYYFTEIKKLDVSILGLDLKSDVIDNCNKAAKKYGYSKLKFELGDINGYKTDKKIHMVITLHACDTATDYALYNAISWGSELIFSVPCCQHELNSQIESDKLSLITRYGIIKERTATLMTDAIRGNLLEYAGYKTQILEFIDMEHTPKNIMLRAVKKQNNPDKQKYLDEVNNLIKEFNLSPTLYKLIVE